MTPHRIAMLALAVVYATCALLAPEGSLATLPAHEALLPPSARHPMGTDDLGRDLLAALLQGGRTSLIVAGIATLLALALGLVAGVSAGLGMAALDEIIMRCAEIVASLPALLVAVLVAAVFGGSIWTLGLVLGLTRWPLIARIIRAETQSLLRHEFLRAAWALGGTRRHVARRHLLPHLAAPTLSGTGIVFGGAVTAEAALAFVGLGDPTATSWGQMVAQGFSLIGLAWWVWLWPAAALAAVSGTLALASDLAGHAASR